MNRNRLCVIINVFGNGDQLLLAMRERSIIRGRSKQLWVARHWVQEVSFVLETSYQLSTMLVNITLVGSESFEEGAVNNNDSVTIVE